MGEKLYKKELIEVKELISKRVYLLSIILDYGFIPGQVVAISTSVKIPARLYSICNSSGSGYVNILFDVVPDGILTNKLAKLKKGDKVLVSKPFGHFIGDVEPSYWIAAGTGIAPFASMFYSGLSENKILIHGGRTLDSFYFLEDFKSMGDRYIRCCTQETCDGVFEGRLTHYLKKQNDLPKDYKYYLCGSAEMIMETRSILLTKGVPFDRIIAEIYF